MRIQHGINACVLHCSGGTAAHPCLVALLAAAAPKRSEHTLGPSRGWTSGATTRLGQAGGGPASCLARTCSLDLLPSFAILLIPTA